ncbi:PREDICTED: mediator of RNA polymerase II transcription subunit 10b-like [Ipomoea nil]|uniref:mediator of RNA polymerase II transcription subunit 10b-like n=1 Tax=Ipomoea nil TaxID=35883 RepID=UPI000900BFA7|nr:PREDICTED: mediator of RNA polymerase II transcription subunit 10b-like [Ipomoea nil]
MVGQGEEHGLEGGRKKSVIQREVQNRVSTHNSQSQNSKPPIGQEEFLAERGGRDGNNVNVILPPNVQRRLAADLSAPVTTGSPPDDSKQNLNHVINCIQKTLGMLHQLYLTVSSFNVASQLPFLQRLYEYSVLEFDNMVKLAEKCDIQVPMEVLNLIDDGKNPDEFTRDVLNSCIVNNQITRGKTDAFKGLRKHLLDELEEAFLDEVEAYRMIRATSAAEAKQLAQALKALPNGNVKVKPEI